MHGCSASLDYLEQVQIQPLALFKEAVMTYKGLALLCQQKPGRVSLIQRACGVAVSDYHHHVVCGCICGCICGFGQMHGFLFLGY